jgi:F-type H+-transporting ATPase subunit b
MAETTHEGTEQPEGHSGAFPPFETSTFASQILWLAIAFGLLYWLMSRLALPRVAGILEGRAGAIASDVKAAQAMKAESDAELGQKLAAAEEAIEKTKATALGNVRTIAVDAAGAIVEKLTGRPAEPASVDKAVDAAIRS